jgi:hypothetical protein
VTEAAVFVARAFTKTGANAITVAAGVIVDAPTVGATNWAILVKTGRSQFGGYVNMTGGNTGSFTLGAAATTVVNNTNVTASSRIVCWPTNAAAALLMSGTKALYTSAKTASTSFTVATQDGTNAAGTETFDYIIFN